MEGIRRALVLGPVLIAGTVIEHAPSVGPLCILISLAILVFCCISCLFWGFLLPYVWCTQHKHTVLCACPVPVTQMASFVNLIAFMESSDSSVRLLVSTLLFSDRPL